DPLEPDTPARATAMRDVITHRGPDDSELHCDAYAALAHRRLSIVDLNTGQQPLANEDGSIWITFNGEIYNHADIRRELEARGHKYRTRSDTESIVHAYEQWGDDCVRRFRGMFAFALWDAPKRRLLLVRLMSDVPLWMFLSGGSESSAIAAIMAKRIDRPLQTFSVAFKEHAFNELAYARQVAQAVGAEPHEVVIDDREFFDALPRLVWHEDEPIAHPSSVPLYFVSELARRRVTVVLTGEG